ncbi:MAG: hypothetical protein ACRCZF_21470, partial [Gemmataceae bacterium]
MLNEPFAQLVRQWVYRVRKPRPQKVTITRPTGLRLETVEDRLAPAVLPAATTFNTQLLAPDTSIAFEQQRGVVAAIDPIDPRRMAFVTTSSVGVTGQVSFDGGFTFETFYTTDKFSALDPRTAKREIDPNNKLPYTNSSAPSLTIGRDGSIYLIQAQHDAAKANGAIVANKFVLNAGSYTRTSTTNVYQWYGGVDPAFNPTIAIDTNLPSIIDPEGKAAPRTSAFSDTVVVAAWNTKALQASNATTWNPSPIMASISGDGG